MVYHNTLSHKGTLPAEPEWWAPLDEPEYRAVDYCCQSIMAKPYFKASCQGLMSKPYGEPLYQSIMSGVVLSTSLKTDRCCCLYVARRKYKVHTTSSQSLCDVKALYLVGSTFLSDLQTATKKSGDQKYENNIKLAVV